MTSVKLDLAVAMRVAIPLGGTCLASPASGPFRAYLVRDARSGTVPALRTDETTLLCLEGLAYQGTALVTRAGGEGSLTLTLV